MEDVLREIGSFASLVTTLETVVTYELEVADDMGSIAGRVQGLVGAIRCEIAQWPNLLDRLQLVANVLQGRN